MSNSRLNERLFMDTVHVDVVFLVDNEEIPGHRLVFTTSCTYFDKLLNGDFKESKSVKVEISGTSAKVFKEVKRYIYLGLLDTVDWKIDDLLGLLSVAHEYQYQELFAEVMNVLEKQPLDINSWPLVNSAAALYDSASLKAKCVAFAEAEVDNFLRLENTEILTDEFICAMFETPKIRTVNQDQLLSSLLQWKKTHCSAQILSVFQKIGWTKVSHNTTAAFAKLFFLNLKNEDEIPFMDQLDDTILEQSECIARLDNVLLKWNKPVAFPLDKHDCSIFVYIYSGFVEFRFMQNDTLIGIPVAGVQFDLSNQYRVRKIGGREINGGYKGMAFRKSIASDDCFNYNAAYFEAHIAYKIYIYSDNFTEGSEITLCSLVID